MDHTLDTQNMKLWGSEIFFNKPFMQFKCILKTEDQLECRRNQTINTVRTVQILPFYISLKITFLMIKHERVNYQHPALLQCFISWEVMPITLWVLGPDDSSFRLCWPRSKNNYYWINTTMFSQSKNMVVKNTGISNFHSRDSHKLKKIFLE